MTDREAMKLALEALEWGLKADELPSGGHWDDMAKESITALRQALEQEPWDTSDMAHRPGGLSMEQEPVAWLDKEMEMAYTVNELPDVSGTSFIPLYTAPPKREWVGLTDEEIDYIWGVTKPDHEDLFDLPRAIEAKLKEKNT